MVLGLSCPTAPPPSSWDHKEKGRVEAASKVELHQQDICHRRKQQAIKEELQGLQAQDSAASSSPSQICKSYPDP